MKHEAIFIFSEALALRRSTFSEESIDHHEAIVIHPSSILHILNPSGT